MKTLTWYVLSALALVAASSASGADANKNVVGVDYTDTIAPAELHVCEAGVKLYNECLREHGVKFSEYAANHETGRNTDQFPYDAGPYTWTDQDASITQSRPCNAIFSAQVNPHLQGESSWFEVLQPDRSHLPKGFKKQAPMPLDHPINYTLDPGRAAGEAFTDAVKEITAAAHKTHWPYDYETDAIEGGGVGAPDYQLDISLNNYAQHGLESDPSLWKMVANVHGQANADALRKSLDGAIKSSSDTFDRYNPDLSYIAGK